MSVREAADVEAERGFLDQVVDRRNEAILHHDGCWRLMYAHGLSRELCAKAMAHATMTAAERPFATGGWL